MLETHSDLWIYQTSMAFPPMTNALNSLAPSCSCLSNWGKKNMRKQRSQKINLITKWSKSMHLNNADREFTAGDCDRFRREKGTAAGKLVVPLMAEEGTANLNSWSSSSSSYSALFLCCKAITLANRWAASLVATFWVRLTVERRPGDIDGDLDSVLLDDRLHWRAYTGLPALLRSILIKIRSQYQSKRRRVSRW